MVCFVVRVHRLCRGRAVVYDRLDGKRVEMCDVPGWWKSIVMDVVAVGTWFWSARA